MESELLTHCRILLVDDEDGFRDALEHLSGNPADVVLLDIQLGDMDGRDVLRAMRRRGDDAAVIILSGHAYTDIALDAMRAGASDYLLKPCPRRGTARTYRKRLRTPARRTGGKTLTETRPSHSSLECPCSPARAFLVHGPGHAALRTTSITRPSPQRRLRHGKTSPAPSGALLAGMHGATANSPHAESGQYPD